MKFHVLTLFPEMIESAVPYQYYRTGGKKRDYFSEYGEYPGFFRQ